MCENETEVNFAYMQHMFGWIHSINTQSVIAIFSVAVGAFIAGRYQLRARENDYRNEFFKLVIQRRLAAYEALEELVSALKMSVIDNESDPTHPYHLLFADESEEGMARPHVLLGTVMSKGLWLSEPVFEKLTQLNRMIFFMSSKPDGLVFAKENYREIGRIRVDLESLIAHDMLTMHDVRSFLKRKRKPSHDLIPFNAQEAPKKQSTSATPHV
jgi:hypothetical protein